MEPEAEKLIADSLNVRRPRNSKGRAGRPLLPGDRGMPECVCTPGRLPRLALRGGQLRRAVQSQYGISPRCRTVRLAC